MESVSMRVLSEHPTGEHKVQIVTASEVHALAVGALRLDSELLNLEAPEAISALVRRAASYASPCPPRLLRSMVIRALRGLAPMQGGEAEHWQDAVDAAIEAATAYGDLLELPALDESDTNPVGLLYLAPPTFVDLGGVVFLLGGLLDGSDPLPSDLRALVETRAHTRRIRANSTGDVPDRLQSIGWVALQSKLWLQSPKSQTPKQLVDRYDDALVGANAAGEVAGLIVLDPDSSPTYYPARWKEATRKTGRFVGRRRQQYGADLWCYVELRDGVATTLVDLPLDGAVDRERPCDAAWHLQMSIDVLRGRPQLFAIRSRPPTGFVVIDLFSPVPLWARRRWDALGEEVPATRSLFAYRFPEAEFGDVLRTLEDELWLRAAPPRS
jgi:hypothetical protein